MLPLSVAMAYTLPLYLKTMTTINLTSISFREVTDTLAPDARGGHRYGLPRLYAVGNCGFHASMPCSTHLCSSIANF